MVGSPPPLRAAMMMARASLLHSLPRRASMAPFLCLIVAQWECPDMAVSLLSFRRPWAGSSAPRGSAPEGRHLVARDESPWIGAINVVSPGGATVREMCQTLSPL